MGWCSSSRACHIPCTTHLPSPYPLILGSFSSPGLSASQGILCALSPEYCSSLCSPSPSQSCYLLTIGQELLPGIGVIWTGEHLAWLCGVCGPAQLLSKSQCLQTLQLWALSWEKRQRAAPPRCLSALGYAPLASQATGQAVGLLSFWLGRVGWGDSTLISMLGAQMCACPCCEHA